MTRRSVTSYNVRNLREVQIASVGLEETGASSTP
jgi:hypothetical protein